MKNERKSEMYESALEISMLAHYKQKDNIDHTLRVASMVDGYLLKTIAVLHDVDEECGLAIFDLSLIPDVVLDALDLLTHIKYEPYKDYIKKISTSILATKVKIADLMDNTSFSRLDTVYKTDPKTAIRLAKKYVWALKYLSGMSDYKSGVSFIDDLTYAFKYDMIRSDEFCMDVWSSLSNIIWEHENGEVFTCSFRKAGDYISSIIGKGNYMDWYCCGPYETVSAKIKETMSYLGWEYKTYKW